MILITLCEISNLLATEIADFINVSAPSHNKKPLNIIYKNDLDMDILLLSKSSENSDIEAAYKLGVNSYIVKPVNFDNFLKVAGQIELYWCVINKLH